jgi:hypothetical protein
LTFQIYDILPLCLTLFGLDVPHGIDGEIREEILSDSTRLKRKELIAALKEKERIQQRIAKLDL